MFQIIQGCIGGGDIDHLVGATELVGAVRHGHTRSLGGELGDLTNHQISLACASYNGDVIIDGNGAPN